VIDRPPPSPQIVRLRELDGSIARDPDAVGARFKRASLLREQGSFEEAKRDYLELLARMPTHFGALNDFGTMLLDSGFRDAARTVFGAAVQHHPQNPMGHVNLANLLLRVGEPPCGSIPIISTPIAAWAISWPRPATRPAPAGTGTGDSRTMS
jgi:predicted Zn-dependent protease